MSRPVASAEKLKALSHDILEHRAETLKRFREQRDGAAGTRISKPRESYMSYSDAVDIAANQTAPPGAKVSKNPRRQRYSIATAAAGADNRGSWPPDPRHDSRRRPYHALRQAAPQLWHRGRDSVTQAPATVEDGWNSSSSRLRPREALQETYGTKAPQHPGLALKEESYESLPDQHSQLFDIKPETPDDTQPPASALDATAAHNYRAPPPPVTRSGPYRRRAMATVDKGVSNKNEEPADSQAEGTVAVDSPSNAVKGTADLRVGGGVGPASTRSEILAQVAPETHDPPATVNASARRLAPPSRLILVFLAVLMPFAFYMAVSAIADARLESRILSQFASQDMRWPWTKTYSQDALDKLIQSIEATSKL